MYAREAYGIHSVFLKKPVANIRYHQYERYRTNSDLNLEFFSLPSDVVVDVKDINPDKYYVVGNIDTDKMGCKDKNCTYDFPSRIFLPYDIPLENNASCATGMFDVYQDPGISADTCSIQDASGRYFRKFNKKSNELLDSSIEEGGNTRGGAKAGGLKCSEQLASLPSSIDLREFYQGAASPGYCGKVDAVCTTDEELIYSVDNGLNIRPCNYGVNDIKIVGAYFSVIENYSNNVTTSFRNVWNQYKANPNSYLFQVTLANIGGSDPSPGQPKTLFVYYTIGTHPRVFSAYAWENWMFDFTQLTDQISLINASEQCSNCDMPAMNDIGIVAGYYTPASNFNFSQNKPVDNTKSQDVTTIAQQKWFDFTQDSNLVFTINNSTMNYKLTESQPAVKTFFIVYTIYSFNPKYTFVAQGLESTNFDFTQITKNLYDKTNIQYRKLYKASDSILDSSSITLKPALFGGLKCSEQIGPSSATYPSWKLIGLGKTGPSYCKPSPASCDLTNATSYTDPMKSYTLDDVVIRSAHYGSTNGFRWMNDYAQSSQKIYMTKNATPENITSFSNTYSTLSSTVTPQQGTSILPQLIRGWELYKRTQQLLAGNGWNRIFTPFPVWSPIDMFSNASISIFNKTMVVLHDTDKQIWYTLDYTVSQPTWVRHGASAAAVELSSDYMMWFRAADNTPWRALDIRTTSVYNRPCLACANNFQTVAKDDYHYSIEGNMNGGGGIMWAVYSDLTNDRRDAASFPNTPYRYLSIDRKPGITNVGVYIDSRFALMYIENFKTSKWQDRSSKGSFIKVSMFDYAVALIGTDRNLYYSPDIRTTEPAFLIAYGPVSNVSLTEWSDGTIVICYISSLGDIRYATIPSTVGFIYTLPPPDPAPGQPKSVLITYTIGNLPIRFSYQSSDIGNPLSYEGMKQMVLTRYKTQPKNYAVGEVTIVRACYNTFDSPTQGDVTALVRQYFSSFLSSSSPSSFSFNVNNSLVGYNDPYPGYLKRLFITYKVGDIPTLFTDSAAERTTYNFSTIVSTVSLINQNTSCELDPTDNQFYRPWYRIGGEGLNSSTITMQKARNGGDSCSIQYSTKPLSSTISIGSSSPTRCSSINAVCKEVVSSNDDSNYTYSSARVL